MLMNKFYLTLFTLLFPLAVWAEAKNPNIILIMADDPGVEGLGCYGGASYSPRRDWTGWRSKESVFGTRIRSRFVLIRAFS